VIVCVTPSVAGSILVMVAPTVLAAQIAPPPLTTLPGAPLTKILSTATADRGWMRETNPAPGSAAQTEPAPLLTASGAPLSCVAAASLPDPVLTATTPFMPASPAGPA
jgi:hypothetical protein